jgi:hypothetical protein
MPSFYTYLDPGLSRRLSYSEYIRNRHRQRRNRINSHTYASSNTYNNTYNNVYNNSYYGVPYDTTTYLSNRNAFEITERAVTITTLKNLLSKSIVKINKDDDLICAICQDEIEKDTSIIRELECKHVYHIECIDKWLSIKNECPMCKNTI